MDELGDSFLVEHVAGHKPADIKEVHVSSAKSRVTGSVRTYQEGMVLDAHPLEYWAEGGEVAEFRRVVPGARSLLKFLSGNATLERLFSAAGQILSDETRKSVDSRTLLMLRYNGAPCGLRGYMPNW